MLQVPNTPVMSCRTAQRRQMARGRLAEHCSGAPKYNNQVGRQTCALPMEAVSPEVSSETISGDAVGTGKACRARTMRCSAKAPYCMTAAASPSRSSAGGQKSRADQSCSISAN